MTPGLLVVAVLLSQPSKDPRQAGHLTARADQEVMTRQFDTAIKLYRDALALSPDFPAARKGLGRVFDLQGRHAEAQAEYQAGLRRADQFEASALRHHLAISLVFERRYVDAERTLKEWFDPILARNNGTRPLGYLEFYQLALAKGDLDEAERVPQTFYAPPQPRPAKPDSSHPDAVMDDLRWARYHAERAILAARRGRKEEANTLLGQARAQFGRTMKGPLAASPAKTSAGAFENDLDEMLPIGEVAFWLGDTAGAIRSLERMTIKLPQHNLMLGQAYEKEKNLQAAREAYRRIVESPLLNLSLASARPIAEARLQAIRKAER